MAPWLKIAITDSSFVTEELQKFLEENTTQGTSSHTIWETLKADKKIRKSDDCMGIEFIEDSWIRKEILETLRFKTY